MKQFLFVVALAFFTTGCLSQRTKEEVVLPAGIMAWEGVRNDVNRGIGTGVQNGDLDLEQETILRNLVGDLSEAFAQEDLELIRAVDWTLLSPWAEVGIQDMIDDGEISVGVATSLRQRLLNFTHLIGTLQNQYATIPPATQREYWIDVRGVEGAIYAGTEPLALR